MASEENINTGPMKKYDWKSNIKTNIFMLRMLGLWPRGDGGYTVGPYVIHISIMISLFMICHMLAQIINIYYILDDMGALAGIFYILIVEFMVAFKVYYLITNMKMLKQLLNILETDMFQPTNSVQMKEIDDSIWFWKGIYKSFLYMCFGTTFLWAAYPFLVKTESGERQLPFIAWYPFETRKHPVYEIIYVHQMASVMFMTTVHVNIDALVAALNVFNGSQFDILCDNLRNLHKLSENIAENLVKCVKHHKEILTYADKSNKFLNWILFVQFFVSAVSIALSMFQLSLMVPLSNEFNTFLFYGVAITCQIFMYCWFGNEIEIKSNNVPYAAFECEWVDFPEDIKKKLLFFVLRAQTPVKLSALNLFYLSLDSFMKIMKTSWSYFALLHQVSTRK